MSKTRSAPLAPAGLAADLAERHARVTACLQERGASCLVAIVPDGVRMPDGHIQFASPAARVLGDAIEDAGPGLVAGWDV